VTLARTGLRRLDLAAAASDPAVRADLDALVRRSAVPDATVRERTRAIVDDVRERGADAVRELNERFGGGLEDGRLVLSAGDLVAARDALDPPIRRAIEQAIANVRRFAATQRPQSTTTEIVPGVEIERRWSALDSVGCYVPAAQAPLPSSLVMTVVPAQVAGVRRIVVASPAGRSPRGVDPIVLGAAGLLGVDQVLVAGGAQAIAALAFGLSGAGADPGTPEATFERVDRIVGPGSVWVTAAKLELAGEVGIDLPAGPSEGLVLADDDADPDFVAADLLTQAEHGPDSPAILVTTSRRLADAVDAAVSLRLRTAPRRAILERALERHGRAVIAPDLDAAIEFVNAYAPEHLSVELRDADLEPAVARLRNAGSLFVGPWAPESAGDYATGANHVLPTGGLARADGALDVTLFGKYVQVQRVTRDGLAALRETIVTLAEAEGLDAHAEAVRTRFRPDPAADEDAR
jgi:histidinol dehydrogenase